jgi:ketosteroid isomerase-like protein
MRSKFWVAVIGVLVLALAGSAVAQMSYEQIILARDEAMNAGDVAMTVSLYADDATYAVIGGPDPEPLVLIGKQAIIDRLMPFAEGNVSYEATVLGVIADTARAFTKWSIDGLRADGFAYLEQFEEFVFENGKIVQHVSTVLRLVPLEEP